MDAIFSGFTGAFSGKNLGMLLAVIVVLVAMEYFNKGPEDLALQARTKFGS